MAVMLCDETGTRYIINCLEERFRMAVTRYPEGTEFDLAGCKFGPNCANRLRQFYSRYKFINSTDAKLDKLLKNNVDAATRVYDTYEQLTFSKCDSLEYYVNLARTLPQGGKYELCIDMSDNCNIASAVLLIMTRPDIEYDIRGCSSRIFEFVRDMWLSSYEHHESYYELKLPNVVRVDNCNGKYGTEFSNKLDENTFVQNKLVLPVEFGNSQIITLDKGIGVSNEWRPTVEKCIKTFTDKEKRSKKKRGKVLADYLQFREEI